MSIRIAKGMRASFTNFEVVSAHETPALLERRTDCHEVLNDVNRLYADIDGKVDVCEEAEFWAKDAQTREEVERLLSGGWKYCLMTASSYEIRKISWRFVILDKAVTKKHNKHIIMGLSKEAMFPEGVAFDTGVYGANRKMRMLGSSKDNENRPLKLVKGTPMDTLISYIPDGVETEEFVEEKKPVGRPSKVKNALLQKVLENTAIHRIETYEDWIQIGIICFNSGVDVEMWDVVSRRGKNYKSGNYQATDINSAGGNAAMNVMNPFTTVSYIIKI